MQPALENVLRRRRDRAIAIVLGIKERKCDPHLPEQAQRELRKVILDQFNDLHSLMMDIADSLDSGGVTLNELYLEKLDEKLDAIIDAVQVQQDTSSPRDPLEPKPLSKVT